MSRINEKAVKGKKEQEHLLHQACWRRGQSECECQANAESDNMMLQRGPPLHVGAAPGDGQDIKSSPVKRAIS